ncbi:MAG: hypothetical protein SWK76_06415 [Actinomycetota bacterium]|nr:hypothetical protein [Actinomycetota bacterium]
MLLTCYTVAGYGNGVLFSLSGVYSTNVLREESSLIQGYLLGFMAAGYIVEPLACGLLERSGISWCWAIAFPALFILPFLIPMAVAEPKPLTGIVPLSRRSLREAFTYDRSLFTALFL